MIITVDILTEDDDATLSTVSIDGVFQCFGLEDEYRAMKIPGMTRIPRGRYEVGLRRGGGFHARYARKFPGFHRGMLQVMDVPRFEHILIHIGNTHVNTAGCLLVGAGCSTRGTPSIASSKVAYQALYAKVIDAAEAGELEIEYREAA